MNEIVRYDNDLSNFVLKNFTPIEQNIFVAIVSRVKDQGTNEVILSFDEVKNLAELKNARVTSKQIFDYLGEVKKKLGKIRYEIIVDGEYVDFSVFSVIGRNFENQTLRIKVADEFTYLFNDLTSNYTEFERLEFMRLKSVYSKNLYRALKQYRSTGIWRTTIDDLRRILDVPPSYKRTAMMQKNILVPAIFELNTENCFVDLCYTPIYEKEGNKRGRPAIAGYKFTFVPEEVKKKKDNSVEAIAERNGWKRTGRYCPLCHKAVYAKLLSNEWGNYSFIGHPNFKTGGCDWHTNEFSQALTKEELYEREHSVDVTLTKEENKERLRETLAGMFTKEV